MLIKKLLITTTCFIAISGAAPLSYADNAAKESSIKALPESGKVSIFGKVQSITNDKRFVLVDKKGETIDVHTESNISFKEGDSVSVVGNAGDDIAGIGHEITEAHVTVSMQDKVKKVLDKTSEKIDNAVDTATKSKSSVISDLPDEGNVSLTGTVVEVEEKKLVLKDSMDKKIDVVSDTPMDVKKGNIVTIEGLMQDSFMGIGDEIKAFKVTVLKK